MLRKVEHRDLRLEALILGLGAGVAVDELAGPRVVRGEQRVDGRLGVGGSVDSDHRHARPARFPDRGHHGLRVRGGDEDALRTLPRHVLDRAHLT